jgi:hypothetical protein
MKLVKMMFYLGQYLMDRNLSDSYPLKKGSASTAKKNLKVLTM